MTPTNDGGGLPILLFDSDSDSEFELPIENPPEPPPDQHSQATSRAAPSHASGAPAQPMSVPRHPITSMRVAFLESLIEVTNRGRAGKPKLRTGNAKSRRKELLDQRRTAGPPAVLWRFRPGQETHEIRRLLAQISFGVYLVLNGLAKEEQLVVTILQGHIDEVDEFLETTIEDIEVADNDLTERIECLSLPMNNMAVFERMLENRTFRLKILQGNQNIEHILARTETALTQTKGDIAEGLSSANDVIGWLEEQRGGAWKYERPETIDMFNAMSGNMDGWVSAFENLREKATSLEQCVLSLNNIINEIEQRAGEVSRRTRFSPQAFTTVLGESTFGLAELDGGQGSNRSRSPQPSPQTTNGSMETTTSVRTPPSARSPGTPPGVSIRRSSLTMNPEPNTSYFDIPITKEPQTPVPVRRVKMPGELEETSHPVSAVPMRNPAPLSRRQLPSARVVEAAEAAAAQKMKKENTAPRYVLQPRIYTTQPPESPAKPEETAKRALKPRNLNAAHQRSEPNLRQAAKLRSRPSESRVDAACRDASSTQQRKRQGQLRTRGSSKPRGSLRANAPESIDIPPANIFELQAPAHGVGSDSKPATPDGSDSDLHGREKAGHSPKLQPPATHSTLVSSPQSVREFNRQVQASPPTALQQRPHTSATMVHPSPPHQQDHRNLPSAMGMSLLSNATSMTQTTTNSGKRTVKKKRSAFGWLKKAFSLDEQERAVFEQKRREHVHNPYYEDRSPKFVDGKRLPTRPDTQQTMRKGYARPQTQQSFRP